jgi:hypothetical protein
MTVDMLVAPSLSEVFVWTDSIEVVDSVYRNCLSYPRQYMENMK